MDDQRARVAAVFDRAAATYDAVGVELFGPIADRLVAELDPRPGERVLDVGCGRGAVLLRAAARVGPTGSVTGVDLAPGMVEQARAAVRDAGFEADLRVADAEDPGGGPYDVVASSAVLFFLPDPLAALRAWRALLADGGRVGVTTFGGFSEAWHVMDGVFSSHLPPDERPTPAPPRSGPFDSDEGVAGLLRQAGFRDVRTSHTTVRVRFDDEEHWHRWSWSAGQRGLWEAVPEDRRDAVRREAYRRLQSCRDASGRIGFDQDVRITVARV